MQVRVSLQKTRAGKFLIVNPDYVQVWEDGRTRISRNTRNGVPYNTQSGKAVPAACRFVDDTFVSAECDFQQWLFDINFKRSGLSLQDAKISWRNLMRGNRYITNFAGSDTHKDCINQANMDKEPMRLQPMATGGTVLKWVAETSKVYFVEAINPYVEFAKYNPLVHWWLFFEPTLSARYWVEEEKKNPNFANDGHLDKVTKKQEWYNEPFPQFGENTLLPVMGMIPDVRSSTGFVNSVDKTRVRFLGENEKIPNPFVMRFGRSRRNPYPVA